jgi:nitrate/nitrite transport system permease protein
MVGGKGSGLPSPRHDRPNDMGQRHRSVYDHGPNDKGIGIQLAYSMARVGLGFTFAALLAIPLGF